MLLSKGETRKIHLDGPDGYASYWRDLRKEPRIFGKRQMGGGSCMVWAAFSLLGKFEIIFVDGRMNNVGYQALLQENLLPYGSLASH